MGRLLLTPPSNLAEFALISNGTATGSDTSIELPGAHRSGDVVVIFNAAFGTAGVPSAVVPSGFTSVSNTTAGLSRAIISAKILTGGESTLTGMNGDSQTRWIAAVFRANQTYASFAVNSLNAEGTSGNPTSQTITASGEANLPILLIGQMSAYSGGVIDPRTISPAMDEIAGSGTNHYAHYKIYLSTDTPVNHSYDMDDEGINILQSAYLDFA